MAKKDRTAGWISKTNQLPKRLFPAKYQSNRVSAPRVDHNVASAYNAQRSKATSGPRNDVEHKQDNNFLEDVPRTRSLSTYDPDWNEYVRSERGKVVDHKNKLISLETKPLDQLWLEWYAGHGRTKSNWFNVTKLEGGGKGQLLLVVRGNEYLFVLQFADGEQMLSAVYQGRERAMADYRRATIAWKI